MAEEIIFGRISTGAQNDLERITAMAYAMVVDYGMSERIGYISFNISGKGDQGPVFDKPYSDVTARMIDEEVKSIIDEVRKSARALLEEHADKLEAMAQALLKKEVLGPKDLVELLGERPHGDYVDLEAEAAPTAQVPENGTMPVSDEESENAETVKDEEGNLESRSLDATDGDATSGK